MASIPLKKAENAQRLRYVRVLERFSKSITNYLLKSEEVSKAVFDKKVDNNRRYLDRIDPVSLYKGELNELEKLVQKILDYRHSDEEIEMIRNELLYMENQLEKSINRRQYKKDKHTADKFKDWE